MAPTTLHSIAASEVGSVGTRISAGDPIIVRADDVGQTSEEGVAIVAMKSSPGPSAARPSSVAPSQVGQHVGEAAPACVKW